MKTIIINQSISLRNKLSLGYFLLLIILAVSVNGVFAQQVIGQYPLQDGGFEGQVTGQLTILDNIPIIDRNKTWKVNVLDLSAAIVENGGRSGEKYANVSFTGTGSTVFFHLQGPSNTAISTAGSYTIQFFYKGDKSNDGTATYGIMRAGLRGGAAATGTNTTIYAGGLISNVNQAEWTKFTHANNIPFTTTNGLAVIQFAELAGKTAQFDIDDVVIYRGGIDSIAPNSPGAVATGYPTASSLNVDWIAAEGGIDGGGYVAVRYEVSPNADNNPNQKGIYAIGNTINNGTGSLTGTVRYIGTETTFTDSVGLSAATSYYYKVYTVDKAFNYSAAVVANGITNFESGLNDLNNMSMHVFVNESNQITVNSDFDLNGNVIIYNVFGQKISSSITTGTKTVISKQFSSGVYFVTLVSEGNRTTKKIIIN